MTSNLMQANKDEKKGENKYAGMPAINVIKYICNHWRGKPPGPFSKNALFHELVQVDAMFPLEALSVHAIANVALTSVL